MKRSLKLIAFLMMVIITTTLLITISKAVNENVSEVSEKSEAYKQWEELPEEERKNAIQPAYTNLTLGNSVKKSTLNSLLAEVAPLKNKFDLRTELSNIKVKNQKKTASCWAFSYSSMLETTMANKYKKTGIEYSPMHVDYKTGEIFNRKIGAGGGALLALAYSASGYGPVNETDFPFDSVYDETNNSADAYYLSSIDNVNLNKIAKARVKDATVFANIFKLYDQSSNKITYKTSNSLIGGTKYSEEQVTAIRNLIKKHITEDGAVSTTFYADSLAGVTTDGRYNSIYYNNENKAYCKTSFTTANHAVTIVGWDDTFSKDNFNSDYKPIHDGAYIVLNSWSDKFADNGYFYVSYDDASIEQMVYGINDMEEQFEYDKLYEYDPLGYNYLINAVNESKTAYLDSAYAANVYTRETSEKEYEYLSEVGIFLYDTEGVEVYVNPADDNKNNAILVATYTGNNALEAGYHTLKLPAPIQLTGTKFVVTIKYVNSDKSDKLTIPLECNLFDSGLTTESNNVYINAKSNPGESFVSTEGTTWKDLINYTLGTYTLKNTNACIKAMTVYSDELLTTPVTGITLDKTSVSMEAGDKVTLSATIVPTYATNKNVTWTSSDESVATVENGIITALKEGTATITVTTEDGNKVATSTITVTKKINTADDIYKDDKDAKAGQTIKEINSITPDKTGDTTVANTILPYTGKITFVIICSVLLIIICAIGIKYRSLKDVK